MRTNSFTAVLACLALLPASVIDAKPVLGIAAPANLKANGLEATAAVGGFSGNDKNDNKSPNALTLLDGDAFAGTDVFGLDLDWTFVGSSDEGSGGPFKAHVNSRTGTLTFDKKPASAFAIALKAGDFYSLYYFDTSFADTTSIDFNTIGAVNNKGKGQALSHASLYLPVAQTLPGGNTVAIPSPSAALAGLVMLAAVGVVRRRRVR